MNTLMIGLRLIHIFSAVVWAGGNFTMSTFVGPTAKAVGPDAAKFMQRFVLHSRFSNYIGIAAILTALSGLAMYGYLFKGIAPLDTGVGLSLTIGGIFGLSALGMGFATQKRSSDRIAAILNAAMAASAPPNPEQMQEMAALQEKMARSGATLNILLGLALIGMTLSEYFAF
ncbi:MAG: hypothetical protein EPO32_00125 [Anaerolineae bacterium]|nr:MAG: hypothetical protein EPO32_00125 [Anaerolineae bacterium]